MATELTQIEYADKHSVFNENERWENNNREMYLIMTDPQSVIKFWKEKRELFQQRIADKLLAAGSE